MKTMSRPQAPFGGATDILREGHFRIKGLLREFESADEDLKREIALRACDELELHSQLERRFFYPALGRWFRDDETLAQAQEAHHVLDVLIAELRRLPAGRGFNAKFRLLAENVLEHMKDEEQTLYPAAEECGIDLRRIGREMSLFKYSGLREPARGRLGLGGMLMLATGAALLTAFARRR